MSKYYYNGVLLPQLPSDVVAQYPNVFIYKWADDGAINFFAAPAEYAWYYYTDGVNQQIRITECTYVRYVYDAGLDAWTFKKEHTDNGRWVVSSDVGAVVWCNTTMVYGTATSTTLYLPKCGVYEQTTDKLDYNGVGLPPLPTEHIGTNPYAWVRKNVTSGYYDLLMDTASWYYDSSSSGIKPTASTTQYWYRISIAEAGDATEWTLYKESSSWYNLDADRTVMWSLQDIASGKDSIVPYVGAMSLEHTQIVPVVKYLIRDDGKLYTVQGSSIVEVAGTLSAELFRQYGMDEVPSGEILIGIYSPEVLCWTSSDDMPHLTATVQGAPGGTHDIISDDIPIGHASIYGMSSIDAIAEGAQFLLSFDGGAWMAYTENKWAASGSGMTADELVAVPNSAWNTLINSGVKTMKLKAVLDGVDTVTQVKFNFDNQKPTVLEESEE